MSQPAPDGTGSGDSGLVTAALNLGTDRLKRALGVYVVVNTTFTIAKRWYDKARSELSFTVSVYEDDDAFPEIAQWVLDRMPEHRRRSVTARTGRGQRGGSGDAVPVDSIAGAATPTSRLYLAYDGTRAQTVVIDGHRIRVSLEQATMGQRPNSSEGRDGWYTPGRLIFPAGDGAGRDAVLAFVRSAADARNATETGPRLYMARRWGGWSRRDDLANRDLDTVVLRDGQKERIVEEVQRFLDNEAAYARLGMPWHFGILLHGPPGTGKTSIARAIAAHFGIDVYYIPLSDLEADATLMELLGSIESRSMLLLEDIDVAHAATDRDDDRKGVTMSGLLNALDGVATPHGLITVMTSNEVDSLADALIRPGRADLQEHVDLADDDQLFRLVAALTDREMDLPALRHPIAAVDVVKVLRSHIDDPDGLEPALRKLVETHSLRLVPKRFVRVHPPDPGADFTFHLPPDLQLPTAYDVRRWRG